MYAKTTTDFMRTNTEIQTTLFLIPGSKVTIGKYISKIYICV